MKRQFIDDFYGGMGRARAAAIQGGMDTLETVHRLPAPNGYLTVDNAFLAAWNYDETAVKVAGGELGAAFGSERGGCLHRPRFAPTP